MKLTPTPDQYNGDELIDVLISAPTLSRRLYKRGGFEGLEANALQVLVLLHQSSGLAVNEIVDALVLGQGTVSTALGLLEARGLVRAKTDEDDRRRQRQHLTRAGQALVRRFMRSVEVELAKSP